ncbi:MAG: phage portal protein [Prevotella sp.]
MIYSDAGEITAANVVPELKLAAAVHNENERDVQFLYDYYKGITPILQKENEVREEINNQVSENRASVIVNFKDGFLLGEPIQYIGKRTDEVISQMINLLNEYMEEVCKAAEDMELGRWAFISGAGYRLTLPRPEADVTAGEAPFRITIPRPTDAFVIYSSDTFHEPLAGVVLVRRTNGNVDYNVYTKSEYFLIRGADWSVITAAEYLLEEIPLIEYPLNMERMGVFEKVLPLLNALNLVQSERVDDVEQFVKSFLALIGAELDEDSSKQLKRDGLLCLPEGADAKYLAQQLMQADTQTLKDDLVDAINEICCMPNRNGGSSTSDTGAATIYRDGWQDAETDAQTVELSFRKPEKRFLRLVLGICRNRIGVPVELSLGDVDIKFTRRNFANLSAKVSAFATLAQLSTQGLVHLKEAYTLSTLFTDPDSSYSEGMKWREYLKSLNELALSTAKAQTPSTDPEKNLEGDDGGGTSAA